MSRFDAKEPSSRRGQALVELLILLPAILLLLLAASDIGKLFVINGKSEIAARYGAFRWYRPGSFEPVGDMLLEPTSDEEAVWQLRKIFFEGSLDDTDTDDEDVGYYPLESGEGGDFTYTPPSFPIEFWNAMLDLLIEEGNDILPISANRATFTYNIPLFPYGREHPLRDEVDTAPLWGELEDPLGTWPMFTAKGDLVYLNEAFYGEGGQAFMDMLIAYGIILDIPEETVELGIAILVFLMFWFGGG